MDKAPPKCHKCGESGHFANKCRAAKGRAAPGGKCFVCGKSGHLRKECPGVEDGGSGQSKFKGKSSARGRKQKAAPQEDAPPSLPATAQPFVDMYCCASVFPKTISHAVRHKSLGEGFPYESFKGAVLSCPLDLRGFSFPVVDAILSGMHGDEEPVSEDEAAPEKVGDVWRRSGRSRSRADSLSSQPGGRKDCPHALGFWVGVPPAEAKAFLDFHQHIGGSASSCDNTTLEHARASDLISRVAACSRVAGIHTGLDYRAAGESKEQQLQCLRLHLQTAVQMFQDRAIGNEMNINDSTAVDTAEAELTADISAQAAHKVLLLSLTPCTEVRCSADADRLATSGGAIDGDLVDVLREAFSAVPEGPCALPVVVRISCCGLQWASVLMLMERFPNCFFSVDCRLTHTKQKLLREYVFDLPLSRLLLESNGPLYPPAEHAGHSAHPGHVLVTAQAIADIKGVELESVLEHCYLNSQNVLKL